MNLYRNLSTSVALPEQLAGALLLSELQGAVDSDTAHRLFEKKQGALARLAAEIYHSTVIDATGEEFEPLGDDVVAQIIDSATNNRLTVVRFATMQLESVEVWQQMAVYNRLLVSFEGWEALASDGYCDNGCLSAGFSLGFARGRDGSTLMAILNKNVTQEPATPVNRPRKKMAIRADAALLAKCQPLFGKGVVTAAYYGLELCGDETPEQIADWFDADAYLSRRADMIGCDHRAVVLEFCSGNRVLFSASERASVRPLTEETFEA